MPHLKGAWVLSIAETGPPFLCQASWRYWDIYCNATTLQAQRLPYRWVDTSTEAEHCNRIDLDCTILYTFWVSSTLCPRLEELGHLRRVCVDANALDTWTNSGGTSAVLNRLQIFLRCVTVLSPQDPQLLPTHNLQQLSGKSNLEKVTAIPSKAPPQDWF